MITYIRDDLFTTRDSMIVHGCNSQGAMGSGVAKIVREKFPGAYEVYRKQYENTGLPLGSNVYYTDLFSTQRGPVIVNAITQDYFGNRPNHRYVSYDAIDDCFIGIASFCYTHGIEAISIPRIGAGLGGGSWRIIERIIEEHTNHLNVNIYCI